jgi:hypothetical protein
MGEWVEVCPDVWEIPVKVGSRDAIARVARDDPQGATWSIRVLWDGTVQARLGGYASSAHARYDLGELVVRSIGPGVASVAAIRARVRSLRSA